MSKRLHLVEDRRRTEKSTEQFLDEAIAFWQLRSDSKLSREDARQITENLTGFFRLLQQWQNAKKPMRPGEQHDDEQKAA